MDTDRTVFKLTKAGMELIKIAPGIDLEKHIFAQMEFKPALKCPPRLMDARIFAEAPMNLRDALKKRAGAPHIFESLAEAEQALKRNQRPHPANNSN